MKSGSNLSMVCKRKSRTLRSGSRTLYDPSTKMLRRLLLSMPFPKPMHYWSWIGPWSFYRQVIERHSAVWKEGKTLAHYCCCYQSRQRRNWDKFDVAIMLELFLAFTQNLMLNSLQYFVTIDIFQTNVWVKNKIISDEKFLITTCDNPSGFVDRGDCEVKR